MGIYDKNGNALSACYDAGGNALTSAYDADGTLIWSANPASFKVANYNVGDWGTGAGLVSAANKDTYLALQNTIFTNVNADICCMQEWSASFCSDGTLSSTVTDNYFDYLQGSGVWAIGSNIAFNDFQAISYNSGGSGDYAKYEKAHFTINGKNVCVINAHLSLTKSTAIAQAAELIQAVNGEQYYIIMGDFNTAIHADEPDYTVLTDYTTIVKQFIDAGMNSANLANFGAFYTYCSVSYESYLQGNGYMSATDHIFTSPNITINSVHRDDTKLNDNIADKVDHVPLIAELTIN